jgi:biotin-(acetyl-CoA carboxylase) ligase
MLTHQNERTFAQLLREYDQHHALIGRRVSVLSHSSEPPITGTCEGLDAMGRLLLRDRSRTLHHVIAGHVEPVR